MDEEEKLDSVNESDKFIGQVTKREKTLKNLITRNVAIFVLDSEGKLLVAKRSPSKKIFPNRYDLSACGNVKSGEDYLQAANRELKEELGITSHLDPLGKVFNEFEDNGVPLRYFTGIFKCNFDGEVKLSDELSEIKKLSIDEVQELVDNDRELLTPGFVNDFIYAKDKLKPPITIMHKKILMVIAPVDFRDEEYFETRNVLEGSGDKITVASSNGQPAKSSFGKIVKPDKSFYDVKPQEYDAIVFVGGSGTRAYFSNQQALALAREFNNAGKVVSAICIAPSILANAGVLNGKRATSFPSERENINAVGTYTGAHVEVDGKIITANGPLAAKDFAKKIKEVMA
jgi:protease I